MAQLRYKLYRRKRHTVTGLIERTPYLPPLPAEGQNGRHIEWPYGITEFWTCSDSSHLPGTGRGHTKKAARAALRKLIALETNPPPLSRRASRKIRRALEEKP